jgi:hypothetical protein
MNPTLGVKRCHFNMFIIYDISHIDFWGIIVFQALLRDLKVGVF